MPLSKIYFKLIIIISALLWSVPSYSRDYSQIITFGDSLSDSGRLFALTGQPPAPYNKRFSNGRVWVEYLAETVGITDQPATNFSVSGALSNDKNSNGKPLSGVSQQIEAYLKSSQSKADPAALYIIWAGSNNFLALSPTAMPQEVTQQVASTVADINQHVTTLHDIGALNLVVMGIPDLGLTPLAQKSNPKVSTALSISFNQALRDSLHNLSFLVAYVDTPKLLHNMVDNPESFSFTNTNESCLDSTTFKVCDEPDSYLFWDSIHPTDITHSYIAEYVNATISHPRYDFVDNILHLPAVKLINDSDDDTLGKFDVTLQHDLTVNKFILTKASPISADSRVAEFSTYHTVTGVLQAVDVHVGNVASNNNDKIEQIFNVSFGLLPDSADKLSFEIIKMANNQESHKVTDNDTQTAEKPDSNTPTDKNEDNTQTAQKPDSTTTTDKNGDNTQTVQKREDATLSADDLKLLSNFINDEISNVSIPGAVLAIASGNKTIFLEAFGKSNLEKNTDMTVDTLFHIGSTHKALTSLLIATLVDDEVLQWDSKAIDIYPNLKLSNSDYAQDITIRHLLDMTSGLPKDADSVFENPTRFILDGLDKVAFENMPDEAYLYSNLSISMAAYLGVVAKATVDNGVIIEADLDNLHSGYERLLREKLLVPLQMNNSYLFVDEARATGKMALSYTLDKKSDPVAFVLSESEDKRVDNIAPAGGLKSTAADMLRFVITDMQQGLSPDGKQIISSKNTSERQQLSPNEDSQDEYGLALEIKKLKQGLLYIGHSGSFDRFNSILGFFPSKNIAFVLLVNGDSPAATELTETGLLNKIAPLL